MSTAANEDPNIIVSKYKNLKFDRIHACNIYFEYTSDIHT